MRLIMGRSMRAITDIIPAFYLWIHLALALDNGTTHKAWALGIALKRCMSFEVAIIKGLR
jgi:hypothetical protein